MDKEKTIQYLRNICELEKTSYLLGRVRDRVWRRTDFLEKEKNKIEAYQPAKLIEEHFDLKPLPESDMLGSILGNILVAFIICLVSAGIPIGLICLFLGDMSVMIVVVIVCALLAVVIGLFCGISEADTEFRIAKEETEKYNREVLRRRERIEEENQARKVQNQRNMEYCAKMAPEIEHSLPIFSHELNQLDIQSSNIEDCLKLYYGMNILYPKYQNFEAVSAFYEYFVTGRTNQLVVGDGADIGAYNLFEQDLKFEVLSDKLDTIIDRLDSINSQLSFINNQLYAIEQNQYVLFRTIEEGNRKVDKLFDNILSIANDMQSTLDSIKNNSEITAFHSEVAAINTEYLKQADIIRTYL